MVAKGSKMSEESKKKISEAKKGKPSPKKGKGAMYSQMCQVVGCHQKCKTKGYCSRHYNNFLEKGDPGPVERLKREPGTGCFDDHGYLRFRINGRNIREHQLIMEKYLGRELLPEENIHHKNGNRLDNRLENLELWVTKQPKGQRPEDLVIYAKEILNQYGNFVAEEDAHYW